MDAGDATSTESLIVLHIRNLNLDSYPTPEIILHKLVTDVKRIAFVDMFELLPLVKCNSRENFKGIFLLDQGKLKMLPIGSDHPPISIINHILRDEKWIKIPWSKGSELFKNTKKLIIDIFELQLGIDFYHRDQLLGIDGIAHDIFETLNKNR